MGYAPDIAEKIYQGMKENTSNMFIDMFGVFAKSLNNFFIACRAAINGNEALKSQTGQITVEAEKLHPLLIGKDYDALSKALPELTLSGGGFVASLGFSYARSGSPTFGKPNKGDVVEQDSKDEKLETGVSMK